MKIQIYIPVLILVSFLFTISCQEKKPEKSPVKKQFFTEKTDQKPETSSSVKNVEETEENLFTVSKSQFIEYNMKLGKANMHQIRASITAAGYIEVPKENKAEVRSYIGGHLLSSPLLSGNYVKKGQYLISLNNLEYIQLQQDYLQAMEELTYLREVFNRKKALAEENITSISSRQQAESEYMGAMAKTKGLRKKIQLININADQLSADNITSTIHLYAPVSGYITMANAIQGKFVEPTDIIFEITNTNHLHLELKVYEKDILKVKKGQKISFRIPEANTDSYKGEVFMVGKTIEEEDRTVVINCHITEENEISVVAGMYVEADIFVDTHEQFCLPVEAFIREENSYYVFVNLSDGNDKYTFKKTRVKIGNITENCIEIVGKSRQQLEAKEVLVEGAFNL